MMRAKMEKEKRLRNKKPKSDWILSVGFKRQLGEGFDFGFSGVG
jgi:hypothetical protein